MGAPAARIGDMHTCPIAGSNPHVGGLLCQPASEDVFIEGMPAARLGDKAICVGSLDTLVKGSSSVFINGKPAVRVGDSTAHGGIITTGCSTVLIG